MIPTSEVVLEFSRSGGPGGQNVNKTSTKATVRWRVGQSQRFSFEQKARIRLALKNKLNYNDELVISSSEERSQPQNRVRAIARLNELVRQALVVKKKRRPTRPTRASKLTRLETKKKKSLTKQRRRKINLRLGHD